MISQEALDQIRDLEERRRQDYHYPQISERVSPRVVSEIATLVLTHAELRGWEVSMVNPREDTLRFVHTAENHILLEAVLYHGGWMSLRVLRGLLQDIPELRARVRWISEGMDDTYQLMY